MQHPANAYYTPKKRQLGERETAPRTPAGRIVRLLGGPAKTADLAGVTAKSVYRWLKPVIEGGTGGRVPHAAQVQIIANAAEKGLTLAHYDFTPMAGEAFT